MNSLRYILRATAIGIWALLLLVPACYYAGRIQHPSPEDYEKSIGREFAMQLEDAVPMIHDPILMEYVSSIGYRITRGIPDRKFEYKFYIINRDVLNAFSVPGGYIYLYTGLISKMSDEDELAAVLSHEIAHVEAQHFINRQKKATVATLSSLAVAVLAAAFLRGDGAAAGVTAAMAANQSLQLAFSREQEREADRLGVKYMVSAGYDPRGIVDLMRIFKAEQRFMAGEIPPYMLTHPMAVEREKNAEIALYPMDLDKTQPGGSVEFVRMKSLIELRMHPSGEVIDEVAAKLDVDPDNDELRYSAGFLHYHKGHFRESREVLLPLLEREPVRIDVRLDLVRDAIQLDRLDEAARWLDEVRAVEPLSWEIPFLDAWILEKSWDVEGAIERYKEAMERNPESIQTCYRLGYAYGKLDEQGEAHYWLARSYRLRKDYKKALSHYGKALRYLGEKSEMGDKIREEIKLFMAE